MSAVIAGEPKAAPESNSRSAGAGSAHGEQSALWAALASAGDSEMLCRCWLALQCLQVVDTRAGLLLLRSAAGDSYVPAAVWPDPQRDLAYLAAPAQEALAQRSGVVRPAPATPGAAAGVHIAYPVETDGELFGVVVLDVAACAEPELQAVLRQLLWGAAWLDALCLRQRGSAGQLRSARAALALEVLATVQESERLEPASFALVNELVTRLKVDRVSLGLMRRGILKVQAISRSASFEAKSQLVGAMANAMDEALDQRATVCEPAPAAATMRIAVAQRDLAERSGNPVLCSVPLICRGEPLGALLFERAGVEPFEPAELESFEAVAVLLAPALDEKLGHTRWLAGRAIDALGDFRDRLFGPRQPLLKLGTLAILLLLAFLTFVEGQFRVSAKTVVEGAVQRAAVAPFEGFIAEAPVRAGDTVRAGQLLARLDDRDLRLDRVRYGSEREQQVRKYHDALSKHERPAARILAAQIAQSEAQIALVDEKLARSRVSAPFDGIVVSGDLSQLLGSPVESGKLLFEITPLDAYRVIVKVDERDIGYVLEGQRGKLALAGLGGEPMPFEITKVTSVSTAQEGRNYFRVEARLEAPRPGVRPGMEGVGKVVVDERKLIWIWTRGLIDWMRITFWTWMP